MNFKQLYFLKIYISNFLNRIFNRYVWVLKQEIRDGDEILYDRYVLFRAGSYKEAKKKAINCYGKMDRIKDEPFQFELKATFDNLNRKVVGTLCKEAAREY